MSYYVKHTIDLNFIEGYDYGENVSTIINVNPANVGSNILINDNESFGVEWKNVAINANYPILLDYNERIENPYGWKHKYDVRATLDIWYDIISGNPSETFTFFLWNDGAEDGSESGTKRVSVNITEKLNGFAVDFSRVKKVRFHTHDGIKDYENAPGNIFTLKNYHRYIGNFLLLTTYYIEHLALSTTNMVFYKEGNPQTFQITTNGNWSLSGNRIWLLFSQASGNGNATITVDPAVNNSATRDALITVNVDGGIETIEVIQYDVSAPPS